MMGEKFWIRSKFLCSAGLAILIVIIYFYLPYSSGVKNSTKFDFGRILGPSAQQLILYSCDKQRSLRNYSQRFLGCPDRSTMQISNDLSILDEIEFGLISRHSSVNRIPAYLFSDKFQKFKAFHNTTGHQLSIYSLAGSAYLVRVPVLDSLPFPNNDSRLLYVFPAPVTQSNGRTVTYFERFNSGQYSTRPSVSFKAAFIIVTDALGHSFDGSILVLTCTRAITVKGCSSSDTHQRLEALFPSRVKTRMCSNNQIGPYVTIISVKKLVILAHTWYNAFYHLTAEAMSRLMMIHELLLFDPEIHILIQRPIYSNTVKELLNLFGIDESRVVYLNGEMDVSTLFQANIIFIPRGIDCGRPPPSLLAQIHSKALRSTRKSIVPLEPYHYVSLPTIRSDDKNASFDRNFATPVKTGHIIFVCRPLTRGRRLADEKEIVSFLYQQYQAVPLVFFHGNLSQSETIELFRNARVLIAPHGAAQVHLLWMRPGTAMLEISPRVGYNGLYETMALYRQIHLFTYFDSNGSTSTQLSVDMTEFRQLFAVLMKDRY